MKTTTVAVALALITTGATAHELTPTYPNLRQSYVDNVLTTRMRLFNRRSDVTYYTIGVFDDEWGPIPFATTEATINVPYLGHRNIDIYIREVDASRVEYICTTSRVKSDDVQSSGIRSKICSRVK
tara:strand:+ start:2448 stop:2825 length:378 start_codon:yes stop_codon:yes gene_type:complete